MWVAFNDPIGSIHHVQTSCIAAFLELWATKPTYAPNPLMPALRDWNTSTRSSSCDEACLQSTDAEWMVSSFRRVLRGVCDCEFLLDHDLKIQGALRYSQLRYSFHPGGVERRVATLH